MEVVFAPGRLKDGVSEAEMLAASDRFQTEFVSHQPGIMRRVLAAGGDGRYADIVFFADKASIGAVMAAEQHNDACHHFMAMWDEPEISMWRVLRLHD